jgi:hypothetical protein
LVDIKITDYCPFNCPACYQGSTQAGRHADINLLYRIAYSLGGAQVFEVAIGGGEPTLHPKFLEILKIFRRQGVVPNFTTRSIAWLRDPTMWNPIMETCGSFALSVEKSSEIEMLSALLETNGIDRHENGQPKINVQVVLGIVDVYSLKSIFEAAARNDFRVTLLGYKTNGRGADVKPMDYSKWLDIILEMHKSDRLPQFGIDTALAAESVPQLRETGVPAWCYHVKEGKFSMYIDAVDSKVGPSSYCNPLQMRKVNNMDKKTILDAFQSW